MAVGTGYSKVASNGLIFAYDTGDIYNSYKGEPTTNICTGEAYSIYNSGATNYRNNTEVAPPVPGYEVVKVVADVQGSYGQCILWRAPYATSPVMTATNSVYAYLTAGSYVQVGQHWWPWNYGSPIYISKNQWVRISNTYNINEGNSYGTAAMVYSTDGIAYFSMPQYEIKSHITPFVTFNETRSNTQGLLDISGKGSTLDLSNVSYDSNAMMIFDGINDYLPLSTFTSKPNTAITCEAVICPKNTVTTGTIRGGAISNTETMYLGIIDSTDGGVTNSMHWALRTSTGARPYNWNGSIPSNSYSYLVGTYDGSTSRAYLNGTEIWNSSLSGAILDATYYVGTYGPTVVDGVHNFNGYLPVSKIYNRALSASEVLQNYSHYKTRFNIK